MQSLVKLYIGSFEVATEDIISVEFNSDLRSQYTTAEIHISDMASRYKSISNIGALLKIIFIEKDTQYVNPMRIIAAESIPVRNSPIASTLVLNVKHAWFFKSTIISTVRGTRGTTTADIVRDILEQEAEEMVYPDVGVSSDRPSVRYQVGERSQEFLERISKYAVQGTLPMYLYLDAKNQLHFRGLDELSKTPASKCLIYDNTGISDKISLPEAARSKQLITYSAYRIINNSQLSYSASITNFATANFYTPNGSPSKIIIRGPEYYSQQTAYPTPPKLSYIDWSKTPSDAIAIAVRQSIDDTLDSIGAVISINGIDISNSIPGTVYNVVFPLDINNAEDHPENKIKYIVTRSIIKYTAEGSYMKLRLSPALDKDTNIIS